MFTPMFLDATAETVAPNAGGNILSLLMIPLLLIIMYFLMIRPQRKQEKEAANMRNSLAIGDEVTTIGGIIGRIVNIKEDTFVLETTKERTRIRFERSAVKRIDRKFDLPAEKETSEITGEKAEKEETK